MARNRMSAEAREVYLERREADRYGNRAQYRHNRRVKRYSENLAQRSYRESFGEV